LDLAGTTGSLARRRAAIGSLSLSLLAWASAAQAGQSRYLDRVGDGNGRGWHGAPELLAWGLEERDRELTLAKSSRKVLARKGRLTVDVRLVTRGARAPRSRRGRRCC
jgi:hypothetical protein